jgi:aspartate/methionine/tyrosine aminotransferase
VTRATSSPYMEWAKTKKAARFNLARSGVPDQPLAVLGASLEDVEIDDDGGYGWPPLLGALGAHLGVPPEEIVHLPGTSMANFVALAGLLEPGDDALIERPAYELLVSAARFLGAHVVRFDRRFEEGFAVDPAAVARAMTPKTRVVVLTNLHNPSSARIPDATLHALGSLAREMGARVLVDEVYLEALYEAPTPTSRRLGPEFVVTSSLTKAWGFSGLRCGWIAAEPDLARRFARLNDLFGVNHARPAETLALRALARLPDFASTFRELLAGNRALVREFLGARSDIEAVVPPDGTVVFPRVKGGSSETLCRLLRDRYDTSVVPGEFFEEPRAFRIGLAVPRDELREGLERIGRALDELALGLS